MKWVTRRRYTCIYLCTYTYNVCNIYTIYVHIHTDKCTIHIDTHICTNVHKYTHLKKKGIGTKLSHKMSETTHGRRDHQHIKQPVAPHFSVREKKKLCEKNVVLERTSVGKNRVFWCFWFVCVCKDHVFKMTETTRVITSIHVFNLSCC